MRRQLRLVLRNRRMWHYRNAHAFVFLWHASLRWRHNELDGVSDHQPHDCLLNRLLGRRLKKTSKLRVTGLCAGNSPETGEFPAQMASNAENVSIWWRHHDINVKTILCAAVHINYITWKWLNLYCLSAAIAPSRSIGVIKKCTGIFVASKHCNWSTM